ncbi:glycosyltransferase [Halococcus saccharolyticus DSM 5350]|uniref:Glycosyltransferase n=2 Tax=Halococcus saccharolyticus TaxID=62319 RepID=M0MK20_9EURY|nr:glycosyltransferase [Halococcus saccharolyticus DSM 5350]
MTMDRSATTTHTEGDPPVVSIVVVNWNNYDDTSECLDTLTELSYPNYRVVVVDNGSTDGSGERLAAGFDGCEFVFTGHNRGFGGGCNAGIERALANGTDYVLLLNNDASVAADTIDELVAVADESAADIVGAMVRDQSDKPIISHPNWYPDMLFYSGYRANLPFVSDSRAAYADRRWWATDRIEGAGVLLSRALLRDRRDSVGQFLDESLFMYCEEVELALWCREYDRTSVVAERAPVVHDGGNSSNRAFQLYYLTRNRVLIAHRYLSGPARVLFDVLYVCSRLAIAGRHVKRGARREARAILRGLADGYRHIEGQVERPS